jgi:predicted RNA methylase
VTFDGVDVHAPHSAVVMDPQFPSGSVIGRADIAFLSDVFEDVPPSLKLAEKLGFRPVDRIAVLSPPSTNALP